MAKITKKIDRIIGVAFQCKSGQIVITRETTSNINNKCYNCYFCNSCDTNDCLTSICDSSDRLDKKDVIFKLLK